MRLPSLQTCRLSFDSTQLRQVIVNLATNASHAIGEKAGIITVRLSSRTVSAGEDIATPDLHEGRYVCLSVTDNGMGMDRATVDRIFDPFFTTKPAGQGTGLGLSVVHGIVSSHGGAITVYSQPGQGTALVLFFPGAVVSTIPVVPQPVLAPERGNPRKIFST